MRLSDKFDLKLYSQTPYFSRSDLYRDLGLSINTFAVCENQIFTAHWHDFYELELIVDGNVTHTVNNREYQLKRGDIHLITQADFHQLHITSPTVTIFNLVFLPKALSSTVMDSILSLGFCHTSLTEKQFNEIYSELQFLLEQLLGKSPYPFFEYRFSRRISKSNGKADSSASKRTYLYA